MSAPQYSYYTKASLDKLNAKLTALKTKGRMRVAEALETARAKGDLKENAEYHAAREAQGLLEAEIRQLSATIARARVIDPAELDKSRVSILSTVKVKHVATGTISSYTLVSAAEADLSVGKISVDSPIGKGLLGKKVNETVSIQVPAGQTQFQILDIEY